MDEQGPGSEIVLGLDDSPSVLAALNWAADYARSAGLRLRRARHLRADVGDGVDARGSRYGLPGRTSEHGGGHREDAGDLPAGSSRSGWVLEVERGSVGPLLVERSRQAAALVLGTRDHVGIERLLVGSVSHHCLSHAICPVVAVPAAPFGDRSAALAHEHGAGRSPRPRRMSPLSAESLLDGRHLRRQRGPDCDAT